MTQAQGDHPELLVCDLGLVEYEAGVELQEDVRERRQADALADVLLTLEHPPVLTRGRRSERADLPMGEAWYLSQGIAVVDVDRGGRVTYHGPGQLVGYPIMRIGDVVGYLRTMESALIASLGDAGVEARVREGLTGVWVGDRKIGSIGVHVQRGVTTHGFAINCDNDLQPFEWVVPCGIEGVRMTSLTRELGRRVGVGELRRHVTARFAEAHGRTRREVGEDALGVAPAGVSGPRRAGRR